MRIFITGGSGFIGSYVAHRLLTAGHELVALVRNPRKLPWLQTQAAVSLVHAGLGDDNQLRKQVEGCGACIHIALGWGDTPAAMLSADTLPTAILLEACLQAGVEKFIYTSSTAVIGDFPPLIDEETKPSPVNLYGATKAASEAYVLAVEAISGMQCTVIRPGYTFGNPVVPGAATESDNRFREIVRLAAAGQNIKLKAGDGTQFIWAGDLAGIYESVINSERKREVYFALSRTFVSWEHIAAEAAELAGSNSHIIVCGERDEPSMFDVSKLEKHFGLKPEPYPHITDHLKYCLRGKA
ncbi:MAG TPA: NAD(P)-dependent oxidoreductase [Gammaproteobacteria bacterium]